MIYVGASNDIEGHLTSKRFATLILTVLGEDNSRMGPVLMLKGQDCVIPAEKSQYAQGVHASFTPRA